MKVLTLIMTTLRARPLPASRLGLASCLLRMGLAVRAANPSRRLLIEGEGDRGGEEDEAEEKDSSLWGRMRTMATTTRRRGHCGQILVAVEWLRQAVLVGVAVN